MPIDFKVDEMMSFYYLWQESLINYDSPRLNDFLAGFDNPQIENIKQTYPKGIDKKMPELGQCIQTGKIKDIDAFVSFLDASFSGYASAQGNMLKDTFNGYHQFFVSSADVLSRNRDVMGQLQDDSSLGYRKEIENLYKVFNVNPQEDKLQNYINLVPYRPLCDGMSTSSALYQNFSATPQPGKTYIENSTVEMEKIGTPLHEATHHIFDCSQLKKNIREGNVSGRLKEVMEVLDSYIKSTSDEQPRGATALSALDEAFAACSSAVMYQKANGGKLPDEWYHGFEAANRLAPKVFPLYMEYMERGKPFDEAFFYSLSKKMGTFRAVSDRAKCGNAMPDKPERTAEVSTCIKQNSVLSRNNDGR